MIQPILNLNWRFGQGLVRAYMHRKFEHEPIVLGGCPRSGTTLLLSILGSHPNIYSIDYETASLYPRLRPYKFLKFLLLEDKFHIRHIPPEKKRVCEKTPGNLRHTEKILSFFNGQVKIINMFRDGRDVVTSRHPESPDAYWVAIDTWINDVRYGLYMEHHPNVMSIRYEDLVSKPEPVLRDICKFLDEPFHEVLLRHHESTNVRSANAWEHGARDIHKNSVKKWERAEHQARLAEFMAHPEAVTLLQQLGYMDGITSVSNIRDE